MMDWMLSAQNDVARLPDLIWQQWWLRAGWSVVVAWLGAWFVSRWTVRTDAKLAAFLALGVWVWLPGSWGGAYWLGLAFQAPSVTSVLLCGLLGGRLLTGQTTPNHLHKGRSRRFIFLTLCGVVLGWTLLLDTLGVWPVSFYNWGFGAVAPAIALGIAALPWIVAKQALPMHKGTVLVVAAIGFFVALRLPTGNLFDALMDPWLWCSVQIALIQKWRQRTKPAPT